jgi:cyanophycin synthetase
MDLLVQGIQSNGSKNTPVKNIATEKDAIMHAYTNAKPGSLITVMCDEVEEALDIIKGLKEHEDAGQQGLS